MSLLPENLHDRPIAALVAWTFATGMVDAISFLHLDHVFVANMTGNVIFAGLAVGGSPAAPTLTIVGAVGGFLVGAAAVGRALSEHSAGAALVRMVAFGQAVGSGGLCIAYAVTSPPNALVATCLGVGLGMQNAVARGLRIPDLTTTVVTLTMTGLAADSGTSARTVRRLSVVLTLALGAAGGALLIRLAGPGTALAALTSVYLGIGVAARARSQSGAN